MFLLVLFIQFCKSKTVWKTVLFSNPVHTSVTRMCGDKPIILLLSGRQYLTKMLCVKVNQVQPSRLLKVLLLSIRGHPLLRRVCTSVLPYGQALRGVLMVLPSRQLAFPFGHRPLRCSELAKVELFRLKCFGGCKKPSCVCKDSNIPAPHKISSTLFFLLLPVTCYRPICNQVVAPRRGKVCN